MVFWKQPRYLHEVWVRSAFTLPSQTPLVGLGMEVPSNVESISVILGTEYWGIFLLRCRKFFPAIKVIPSEPLMQSREDTANKVLQDTGVVLFLLLTLGAL